MLALKEELMKRIPTMSPQRLQLLLDSSFTYISIPELKEVPLAVMEHMTSVPKPFLEIIAKRNHRRVYESCSLKIKRQLWEINTELFNAELDKLFAGAKNLGKGNLIEDTYHLLILIS